MDKQQIENQRLQIVMKPVNAIAPYEKNPRHNDRTIETLKRSIEKYKFRNPIILDDKDIIVAGHARLKAALLLGLKEVPCVYATGLTDEQIRAYRIADNKTAEIAGWDYDKLMTEMQALSKKDFDLYDTGFNFLEQIEYAGQDKIPRKMDTGAFRGYEQNAEETIIQSFNVAIICNGDAEKETLKQMMHENGNLKRLYRAEDLMKTAGTYNA